MADAPFRSIRSMSLRRATVMVGDDLDPDQDVVVISIVTPGDAHPPFTHVPHWLVIEQQDGYPPDSRDVSTLVAFVRAFAGQGKMLVIHCLMGQSRSPSLAAGIAEAFGMDPWHQEESGLRRVSPMPSVVKRIAEAFLTER